MSDSGHPPLRAERLLMLVTGCVSAAFLPYWLNWLGHVHPRLETRVVVTRSAARFVSRRAIAAIIGREAPLDAWAEDPEPGAPHVDYAGWPDTVLVYPASYNFLSRFAGGLGDTPALLALQCTSAPIGIAPALPPGATGSHAYQRNLAALAARPNVVVADPVPTVSFHTRDRDASAAAPLPFLLERVEKLRETCEREAR
ncbi:flavoprotein [Sphaerisporangium fuscum]|uniref:flavoprotein n=1 Tax=Sphaerisporangium fuscum TaxID=2835868 RepID=UPI001BDBC4C6|nr:flavoprotein [Sphaerisporangium fuscum]